MGTGQGKLLLVQAHVIPGRHLPNRRVTPGRHPPDRHTSPQAAIGPTGASPQAAICRTGACHPRLVLPETAHGTPNKARRPEASSDQITQDSNLATHHMFMTTL